MEIQKFIENHRDDINSQSFENVYDNVLDSLSINNLSKFTELLYKCGIDPLEHMTKIPVGFAYGSSLKNIKIPNSITFIGAWAFAYCIALTSMTIPDSVTTIGPDAFYNCMSLKAINYSGSKKQWELIKKRLNWKNKSLIQIIHCLDGDITL